jgi:hypothetical protein
LPFGAGMLTAVAFLACSIYFFEMIMELLGVVNLTGTWNKVSPRMRQLFLGVAVTSLLTVLASGAALAALRGAEVDAIGSSAQPLGSLRGMLIIGATVGMSTAVFVALGLSGGSLIKSALHLYAIIAACAHGMLAFWILSARMTRIASEWSLEFWKALLRVLTAPWRHLFGWLSRYAAIRNALRLEAPAPRPEVVVDNVRAA